MCLVNGSHQTQHSDSVVTVMSSSGVPDRISYLPWTSLPLSVSLSPCLRVSSESWCYCTSQCCGSRRTILHSSSFILFCSRLFVIRGKVRATENIYKWVSLWWETTVTGMTNGIPKLWNSDILITFRGTLRSGNYFAWDNPFFFQLFSPHFFCFWSVAEGKREV
jgi:hypothetical protein